MFLRSERDVWCGALERDKDGLGFVGSRISFLVGNRRRVRFWRDRWCGDSLLCVSFPFLFALIEDKKTWMADIWKPLVEGGWGGWNPCFSRAFNDWEVEEVESFMERLHGKRVRGDVEDMVFWTKTKSGSSQSNPFTMLLSRAALLFFLQVAFETCGCSPRLASLLGRLCETKL